MSPVLTVLVAVAVRLLELEGEGHPAEKFLGLPLTIWQALNLVLFLAVLIYFVARPLSEAFRKRQLEIEKRAQEADHRRAEVERLTREIEERAVRLEREIEEVRRQGISEGQSARAELLARAEAEAERVRREAAEEIDRRVSAARSSLRQTAADLTASAAVDLVARAVTDEDRERLVLESAARIKAAP